MKKTGKYIAYLMLGLFTATAFISSCTEGNGPEDINHPKDKVSLSISFQSEQHTGGENGLRANSGGEIDPDVFNRESAVYSLAVFVFKNGTNELDGSEIISRESKDPSDEEDYKILTEIKEIALTAGIRDVYIIANAPDGHFTGNENFAQFTAKMEDLSNQKIYGSTGVDPEDPIGGVTPADRFTNLAMSQSFTGLPLNSGAPVHYLGYMENGGRPASDSPGTPLLRDGNPIKVELVRLVARVAIQKITFQLPPSLTFDTGRPTSNYNHYVDTVFLLNAKTSSSYFPGVTGFTDPDGSFGHGNDSGYDYLKDEFPDVSEESTYAEYLSIPINFEDYDITGNHAPVWFYAFENSDSGTDPTAFVIGVKYQYINPGETEVKIKKVYYPVVINRAGGGSGDNEHYHIKRNNQYGIRVTIKGLGDYITDYTGLRSAVFRAMNNLSDMEGIIEIEETIGTDLFPWTGNVYK